MIFAQTLRPRLLPLLLMGVVCLSSISCQMPTDRGRVNPTDYRGDNFRVIESNELRLHQTNQFGLRWDGFNPPNRSGFILDFRYFETDEFSVIAKLPPTATSHHFAQEVLLRGMEFRLRSFWVNGSDTVFTHQSKLKYLQGPLGSTNVRFRSNSFDISIEAGPYQHTSHAKLVADNALDEEGNMEILIEKNSMGRFVFIDKLVNISPLLRKYTLYTYLEFRGELVLQNSANLSFNLSNTDIISDLTLDILSESRTLLKWSAPQRQYEGFRIYRVPDGAGPVEFVAQVASHLREFVVDEANVDYDDDSDLYFERDVFRQYRMSAVFRNPSGELETSKTITRHIEVESLIPSLFWQELEHLDEGRARLNSRLLFGAIDKLDALELHLFEEVEPDVYNRVSRFDLPVSSNISIDFELDKNKFYQLRAYSKTRLLGISRRISLYPSTERENWLSIPGTISNLKVANDQVSFIFSQESQSTSSTSTLRAFNNANVQLALLNIPRAQDFAIRSDATKLVYLTQSTNQLHLVDYPSLLGGMSIFTFPSNLQQVTSIALSLDGRQIYATNSHGSLFVFDMDSEAFSMIDDAGMNDSALPNRKIQISADGRFVYYANSHLKRYDTLTNQIQVVNGLPQGVWVNQFIQLNNDGDFMLAIQSQVSNSTELYKLDASTLTVSSVPFSSEVGSISGRPGFPNYIWVHSSRFVYGLNTQTGEYRVEMYLSSLQSLLVGIGPRSVIVMSNNTLERRRIPFEYIWSFI